jgi:hypothetical protein
MFHRSGRVEQHCPGSSKMTSDMKSALDAGSSRPLRDLSFVTVNLQHAGYDSFSFRALGLVGVRNSSDRTWCDMDSSKSDTPS